MSTYIESFIMFILCAALYSTEPFDVLHIACILFLLAIYCFEFITNSNKTLTWLGIIGLIICFGLPELSIFLPLLCYVFFYRKSYLIPCLSLLPSISYLYRNPDYVNYSVFLLGGLSFYLAYENCERTRLKKMLHTFRDNSVETEMTLKQRNRRILENQNDQIYIATLKERNRIAREIHDNVGHMLSRSILQVGALLAVCKDETLNPHLETLKDTLDYAMNSIRNSVHDLHDESIDLKQALEGLTKDFTFCQVFLDCDVSKLVPKDVKYCFLALTKEAMNNTMKHSNATKLSITIKEHPAFYQLLIEDNGTTTHTISEDTSGIGLINMKERVNAIHGIIHISNEQGFRIFVSVPK